ncbi:reverse transcriptase domain, Reverse transcriptase zinc-binding domain protein [Artemisia annua]|uniref:Reverse transcriptase domain, Reverse transcriptase zinc-binding domain protein n=1 Tax=Artemisia annua TaxID=35608 RepID=A0A2U1LFC8_ARTAN|nr:reverse transcriptase domain, Reverse transcriptase zinc-binding domain protein [Artemisia annua]
MALASKVKGGLGIGSLYSLNHTLIQKWQWRFFKNPGALWVQVITTIHDHPEDTSYFFNHVRDQGVWGKIVGSINSMHEKGIPHSTLKRKVNNGLSTKFWTQTWIGNDSIQHQFSSLFRLAMHQDRMIHDWWNNAWSWEWSRPFTGGTLANHLHSLRSLLDNISLNDDDDV